MQQLWRRHFIVQPQRKKKKKLFKTQILVFCGYKVTDKSTTSSNRTVFIDAAKC